MARSRNMGTTWTIVSRKFGYCRKPSLWKQFNKDGFLQYPNFLETIVQVVPMFRLRAIGGILYLLGTFLMAYNLYRTAKAGEFEPDTEAQAAALEKTAEAAHGKYSFH